MSTKRSKRMKPLLDLAKHREREEAARLGGLQKQLSDEQAQLQALSGYKQEYSAGALAFEGKTMSAQSMRDYHRFVDSLDGVIDAQQGRIRNVQHQIGQQTAQWQQAHVKMKSLDKLVIKVAEDEQREQSKWEQKQLDDLSASCRRP